MKKRKTGRCPKCSPNGRTIYTLDLEVKGEEIVYYWCCTNCGHALPVRKAPARINKQKALIELARKTIEGADTLGYKLEVEWKETACDNGDISLRAVGKCGPENTLLSAVTSRTIGMNFSIGGGLTVYFDSKYDDLKSRKLMENDLRRGRKFYW